uniref:Uncharacterized protein n=1 Tax=Leersia perrieri TaxID=77586 RepID=A0A0D9X268_9ORYZ
MAYLSVMVVVVADSTPPPLLDILAMGLYFYRLRITSATSEKLALGKWTVLLKSHTEATAAPHHNLVIGTLWLCESCLSYALYYIIQARLVRVFPSTYLMTTLTCLLGSLQSFIVGVFVVRERMEWRLRWDLLLLNIVYSTMSELGSIHPNILCVAYDDRGMFNTGIVFLLLTWVIGRSGPRTNIYLGRALCGPLGQRQGAKASCFNDSCIGAMR